MIRWLDHVNVRTAHLDDLVRFYGEVLGLHAGARPPLGFDGARLLEHFAFAATGLGELIARLERHGVEYRMSRQPGIPTPVRAQQG